MKVPFSDSSADPLLDEHFRRSLGANYETLFKKNSSSSCSESGSSSTESSPPKVPQLLLTKKDSSKTESSDKSQELDPTKVPDPVKAFREDMNMEGYTGKATNRHLSLWREQLKTVIFTAFFAFFSRRPLCQGPW